MKNDNTAVIRDKILALIEAEYESDAAFERAVGLADKATVYFFKYVILIPENFSSGL